MTIVRPSFANRGPSYTPYGCQIRCVRPDETSATVGLNYLSDGQVMFRFSFRKQEFLVPALMVMKVGENEWHKLGDHSAYAMSCNMAVCFGWLGMHQ